MTSPFVQPNNEVQNGGAYKNNIDNGFAVMARIAAAFHIQAQNTPDMTVRCLGGPIWNGASLVEVAASNSGEISPPVSFARIDRVIKDPTDGSIYVISGDEASEPEPPSVPVGRVPLARILLSPAQAEIVNSDIIDERTSNATTGRTNYNGEGAPDENDDVTQGYAQGSAWYDMVGGEKYVCTNPAAGEAIWQKATLTLDELLPLFNETAKHDEAVTVADSGAAYDINFATVRALDLTFTDNCDIDITNPPSGAAGIPARFRQGLGGNHIPTFLMNVVGEVPEFPSEEDDYIDTVIYSLDGGASVTIVEVVTVEA